VLFEDGQDADDRRMVETLQSAPFADEAFESPLLIRNMVGRQRQHLMVGASRRNRARQVFLDRNGLIEIRIEREVGDPEAAVTERP